jgi:hypothetical protein
MLMTEEDKENMKEMMDAFYKWKQNSNETDETDENVMIKLANKRLNLGVWKHIEDEIRDSEDAINKLKTRIIILKNEVLYDYIGKEKAIAEYTKLRTELVDESDRLKLMFDYYIEKVDNLENELKVQNLQKEYNENMVSLKNKMKLSRNMVDSSSKRKNNITEIVRLSMFLTDLSEKIRNLKYPTVFYEDGLIVKPYIFENMFRAYKNRQTVLISSFDNKKKVK